MLKVAHRPTSKIATPRNPEQTRARLVQSTFQEVYKSGFRGTDLETILDRAGVTKGALYHYFDSKEELGYAIVDEVLTNITQEKWVAPLQNAMDPIDALAGVIESTSLKPEYVRCGCPLNNLAQEMSPLDEGFRIRLEKVFELWHGAIAGALREGQKRKLVRSDIEPKETATFLIATYEGYMSLAKISQDAQLLQSGKRSMVRYLDSLRASDGVKRRPGRA